MDVADAGAAGSEQSAPDGTATQRSRSGADFTPHMTLPPTFPHDVSTRRHPITSFRRPLEKVGAIKHCKYFVMGEGYERL